MNQCPKCNTPLVDFRFLIDGQVEVCEQWCPTCNCDELSRMQDMSNAAMVRLMHNLGVPSRYVPAHITTAMYDGSSLDFSKGTIWYGESGTGKTWQMVGMMKEAILTGFAVKFFDWSEIMCKLRCKPDSYEAVIADIQNQCGLVAIDDFYVDNNYTYDYVYNIIKVLHGAKKPLLMTASELPAQPKIAMRLAEMTNQYEVVNEWK